MAQQLQFLSNRPFLMPASETFATVVLPRTYRHESVSNRCHAPGRPAVDKLGLISHLDVKIGSRPKTIVDLDVLGVNPRDPP